MFFNIPAFQDCRQISKFRCRMKCRHIFKVYVNEAEEGIHSNQELLLTI